MVSDRASSIQKNPVYSDLIGPSIGHLVRIYKHKPLAKDGLVIQPRKSSFQIGTASLVQFRLIRATLQISFQERSEEVEWRLKCTMNS